MQISRRRERKEETTYSLYFERISLPGSGFSFPCDKDGKVFEKDLHPCALTNYQNLVAGKEEGYKAGEITSSVHRHVEPAVGLCNHCNKEVPLHGFTNTCECGTDYNMSGQELAPREQWGEETGESLSDILGVDGESTDDLLEGDD